MDELTNRELNLRIATEVMGWDISLTDSPFGKDFGKDGFVGVTGDIFIINSFNAYVPWEPTKRISLAWQVVEKMIADGWEFALEYANWNPLEGQPPDYHWVTFFGYYTDDEQDARAANAEGPSVPLVICRAALKAAGVDDGA